MVRLVSVLRVLLGLPFVIFGLNVFFGFVDMQPQPEEAREFMQAMGATGFMHPLRGGVEVLAGALLVVGFAVPLALVMLAPILVHIVGYHLTLDPNPEGQVFAAGLVVLFVACSWAYRARLFELLKPRPT